MMPRPKRKKNLLRQLLMLPLTLSHFGVALSSMAVPKSVRIHATKAVSQRVAVPPCGSNPLHEYMQLPAAQYACVPMPLNSSLTRVEGSTDEFCLEVPKMRFNIPGVQSVHVIPHVMARVSVLEDHVSVCSNECTIRGSPIIEKLRLNDRFDFTCVTKINWDSKNARDKRKDEPSSVPDNEKFNTIRATSEITVDFYPTGIFARVPRRLQRGVGNVAMYLTLSALLSKFMRSLGRDYEKWSTDSDYRDQRRQLELELEQELSTFGPHRRLQKADKIKNDTVRKRALFRLDKK